MVSHLSTILAQWGLVPSENCCFQLGIVPGLLGTESRYFFKANNADRTYKRFGHKPWQAPALSIWTVCPLTGKNWPSAVWMTWQVKHLALLCSVYNYLNVKIFNFFLGTNFACKEFASTQANMFQDCDDVGQVSSWQNKFLVFGIWAVVVSIAFWMLF